MDGKRSGSQQGESLLEEEVLDSGNGLKSFSGDFGFTASVESIFEDLSPETVSNKDQPSSPLENVNRPRIEFKEQGGLE